MQRKTQVLTIYHGTSESAAREALRQGILPREELGNQGNWKHTVKSNPRMVYLTTAYAPYFAVAATNVNRERAAIVQADFGSLDQTRLYPDEDFIEQALEGQKVGRTWDINKRTRYIIRHIEEYRENWKLSLENLGNVCFKGPLPAAAITKVVLFDLERNPKLIHIAGDPVIHLLNFELLGEWYRATTRWFMGEEIDPVAFVFPTEVGFGFSVEELRKFPQGAESIEAAAKMLGNRSGLEVLFDSTRSLSCAAKRRCCIRP
jgi:hypothetical protein